MTNRLNQLLDIWFTERDNRQWVLATIIDTAGSSYRKLGAMMLINDLGQSFGVLSGGCLESDIMRQARRCWENGLNRVVEYGMREEDSLAWQLGIGCGGMVKILLQAINHDNDYLGLEILRTHLHQRDTCFYESNVDNSRPKNAVFASLEHSKTCQLGLSQAPNTRYFTHKISPVPFVAIFGGGVDAMPLVAITKTLGWDTILLDPRVGYAKTGCFDGATKVERRSFDNLYDADWLTKINAAFVLTHNLALDAQALSLLTESATRYLGLLGPLHRTEKVLEIANISREALPAPLANPAGMQLGGELPESIALSIICEAHAIIERADGKSISGVLQ